MNRVKIMDGQYKGRIVEVLAESKSGELVVRIGKRMVTLAKSQVYISKLHSTLFNYGGK